jgi:acyl-coenzyme A synthetase/AMP-(fatty) acid ligase
MDSGLVNIAAHLPRLAEKQPFRPAVVFPELRMPSGKYAYSHYTFQQLDRESNRIASGLEKIQIERGVRTVLMVTPSLEFFALTFALFKLGAIPILIDPGMGLKNLKQCIDEAEPEAFIGVPKAHLARVLLKWGRKSLQQWVTVNPRGLCWGHSLKKVMVAGDPDSFRMSVTHSQDMAAILFTSGSTGVPKGAVYTHGNFSDQVEKLRTLYDIQPGEMDLPTFPLFALFGPAMGMTAVIPDMDPTRPAKVDPSTIIAIINDFGISNMFGSPALINRVSRYGETHNVQLPSLRRVISAGAPVPANVLERFSRMVSPEARIHTPYGATESLPVCSIESREILGETREMTDKGKGVCIGKRVPGIEVKVIGITNEPINNWDDSLLIKAGEIGEIVVKGANVTRSYFRRNEATRYAKIPIKGTDEFYHRMGDVGYFDSTERLWFCGRKTHRIVLNEETLFTIPCEAIFNTHTEVFRSALVGVSSNGNTMPVICIELEPAKREQKDFSRIKNELLEKGSRHELTHRIQHLLFHTAFPVDIRHNAKIFREKLAVWAERTLKI